MALSAFFFAAMAAVAKLLGGRIDAQEVIFVRGVLNVLFMLWLMRRRGIPLRPRRPGLLVLRGALGYAALSCYFWSVSRQPLASAILLQQVHPVFTAVLAAWFLAERPGRRFAPAFVLAVAGVWLVAAGAQAAALPAAGAAAGAGRGAGAAAPVLVGLLGAVLSAGAYVTVRHASMTEAEEAIVLWFPLTTVPLSFVGTLAAGPVLPTPREWLWLLVVAGCGQLGQLYLTRGLARVPAGRATLANPLTILFGAILGLAVFGEPIGWRTAAGGGAIVAAVLLAGSGPERDRAGDAARLPA